MATARPKTPGRVKPIEEKSLFKPGRPRKEPPPDAIERIKEACATGASKVGVAMALGTSGDVLVRWLDEYPALKEAFTVGREKERQTLHNVLYQSAIGNNGKDSLIASMFLLKSRHGYQEGQQEGQANRVSINFTIPGAQPLNQFLTVENEPNRTQSLSTKLTRST